MSNAEITPARGWQRLAAGVVDMAIAAAAVWGLQRRFSKVPPGGWSLEPWVELVRQQLGSPGQRLLGLRTVDKRTGRRIELWRSLVVLAASSSGQMIVRRLRPRPTPEQESEHERFRVELRRIHDRYPEDSAGRDEEMRALFGSYPGPLTVKVWRSIAPVVAVALINLGLRRRLAPTTEILVRRGR
jgi:hypothetical protein